MGLFVMALVYVWLACLGVRLTLDWIGSWFTPAAVAVRERHIASHPFNK